jgi:hypothetical protein
MAARELRETGRLGMVCDPGVIRATLTRATLTRATLTPAALIPTTPLGQHPRHPAMQSGTPWRRQSLLDRPSRELVPEPKGHPVIGEDASRKRLLGRGLVTGSELVEQVRRDAQTDDRRDVD